MTTLRGTVALVRLAARRDRVAAPLWGATVAAMPLLIAAQATAIFGDFHSFTQTFNRNASMRLLLGPVPSPTLGGLVAWRTSIALPLLGLATALTVIRHTRADEQAGRAELLGSTAVGRHAPLAASVLLAALVSAAVGTVVTAGMTFQAGARGAIAMGLAYLAAGVLFAGVGAVAAQLAQAAGSARGIALGTLGVSFLVRGVGDADTSGGLSWLSWVSPLGWLVRVRPYGDERWWALVPAFALAGVLVLVAFAVESRRDHGSGVVQTRPGPRSAPASLSTPLGLAWRLHRPLVVGWTAGFAVFGAVIASVASGARDLLDENPGLRDLFARLGGDAALVETFVSAELGFVGLVAGAYCVQAALRLRVEEVEQRAEPVLATGVSRLRWSGAHVALAAAGPAVALLACGLAGGLALGLAEGDVRRWLPRVVAAALVQVPAAWLLGSVAVALFGAVPRAAAVAWGVVVASLLVGEVGAGLGLPQVVLDLAPGTHVPRVPAEDLRLLPLAILAAVGAGLAAAGLAAFARRDSPA